MYQYHLLTIINVIINIAINEAIMAENINVMKQWKYINETEINSNV